MKRVIFYSIIIILGAVSAGNFALQDTRLSKSQGCFSYEDYVNPPINFDLDQLVNRSVRAPDFISRSQSVADTFAWKTFVAINWPVDENGQPDASVCLGEKPAKAVWERWTELGNIITNGRSPFRLSEKTLFVPDQHAEKFNKAAHTARGEYLFDFENKEFKAFQELEKNDSLKDWPIIDQHGSKTYFQTFYNTPMTRYIRAAGIDDLDGFKKFTNTFPHVDDNFIYRINGRQQNINRVHFPFFISQPVGTIRMDRDNIIDSLIFKYPSSGSLMIKTAWKVIDKSDDPDRFYTRNATVFENDREEYVRVGLVAMHIAIRYSELPQWLWATFEHTDNVPEILRGQVVADPKRKYSYYNTSYGNNVNVSPDEKGRARLARLHPITNSARNVNTWMHDQMKAINPKSVWQYYDLVGSQWPLGPKIYPDDPYYTGNPQPEYLSNAVFENFRQHSSCMSCHSAATVTLTDNSGKKQGHSTNFVRGLERLNEK